MNNLIVIVWIPSHRFVIGYQVGKIYAIFVRFYYFSLFVPLRLAFIFRSFVIRRQRAAVIHQRDYATFAAAFPTAAAAAIGFCAAATATATANDRTQIYLDERRKGDVRVLAPANLWRVSIILIQFA